MEEFFRELLSFEQIKKQKNHFEKWFFCFSLVELILNQSVLGNLLPLPVDLELVVGNPEKHVTAHELPGYGVEVGLV